MKKVTVDSPMTYEDMVDVAIRLDEIELLIEDPSIDDTTLFNLIGELETLTSYLEKANRVAEFKQKGFRIIQ